MDTSGTCAIIVLIINKTCYVANVGDSRAILSQNCGKKVVPLSTDHKPAEANELKRIKSNGGKTYKS